MDGLTFLLGLAGFVLLLAALAGIGDDWDRRDARRRNRGRG